MNRNRLQFFENVFKMFLKKASHSQKKASRQLPHYHNGQSAPAQKGLTDRI
jgi:hypothetical protein